MAVKTDKVPSSTHASGAPAAPAFVRSTGRANNAVDRDICDLFYNAVMGLGRA